MKKSTLVIGGVAVGVIAALVLSRKKEVPLTVEEKRRFLQSIEGDFRPDPFNRFTDQEILDTYDWVSLFDGDKMVRQPSPELDARIKILSVKYGFLN